MQSNIDIIRGNSDVECKKQYNVAFDTVPHKKLLFKLSE